MTNISYQEYNDNDQNITVLDPKILVFHNAISDCSGYIDFYEKNMPWGGWFCFGSQVDIQSVSQSPFTKNTSEFPTLDEWNTGIADVPLPQGQPDPYKQALAKAFYSASKFYVTYTNHTQPSWIVRSWSLARYVPDVDMIEDDELTMNYHTDHILREAEIPGEKFSVTAVFYPNDDYGGGGISFRLIGDNGIEKQIDYKPRAGDIVMFPSGHPYYHGVKRITGAPKYITRIYWMYSYEGSEDWHNLKAKYGEEKFAELEQKRLKNNDIMLGRPYMRPMFKLKEYYDFLESGMLETEAAKRRNEAEALDN